MVESIRANADLLGVTLVREPFTPKSLARIEGSEVALYSDPESLPWFGHAVCKAFWLGEPEHRVALNGTQEKRWSANEERECLAALLVGYLGAKEDGKMPPDPVFERIHRILNDDLIDGFIYYEIMARLSPDTVLLLPEDEQLKVERYVERYVVPVKE